MLLIFQTVFTIIIENQNKYFFFLLLWLDNEQYYLHPYL